MKFAQVIINVSLDRAYDYIVPPELQGLVKVGSQVIVPFGRSAFREGYVVSLSDASTYDADKLKAIAQLCSHGAHIPDQLIRLGNWIADYYCCSFEQAVRSLLPAAVRTGKIKKKTRKIYALADAVAAEKFIAAHHEQKRQAGRLAILKYLLTQSGALPLEELVYNIENFSENSLKNLVKEGLVNCQLETVRRDSLLAGHVLASKPMAPSPDQAKALAVIDEMLDGKTSSHVMLLFGVTNSGKTEVYLQAIAKAAARQKSAIVLVPEISLTPQTVRRFRARFGDRLSVLHSRLTDAERFEEWSKINEGEVDIVVGARSALFAPLRNLGLIIVDEEHDGSYKQAEAPRYSARDVAVMRGKMESAAVILGSATPAAESFFNAVSGKYLLAEMAHQVEDKLPPVIRVIDQHLCKNEANQGSFFSPPLVEAVFDRLRRSEQVILFLNRRGFARVMVCHDCGFEAKCPDCSVNYTYSRANELLSCHLCGAVIEAPRVCPVCGSESIKYVGVGTEKVEAAAVKLFQGARIGRMDSDNMRKAEDYERVLNDFKLKKLDILIGTQMIAKGLHFPGVTLVGLINADLGLKMPDFRAPERTFQLITQVAGRAGRGDIRGEVLIQTYNPEDETIVYAANQDFIGFQTFDLEIRKLLHYPPYTHLMAVHFRGVDENKVVEYANSFADELRKYAHEEVKIAGPSKAPIERIKGKYRYMLIIRGNQIKNLRQLAKHLIFHRPVPREVEVYADVDALALL